MIKYVLKSSVSIFVLLGAIVTLNPSYAGNSGIRGEKDPNEKKSTSFKKNKDEVKTVKFTEILESSVKSKKSRSKKQNSEEPALEIEVFSSLDQVFNNEDILKLFLFCCGIDEKTTATTLLICKKWNSLITEEKNTFIDT